MKRRSFIIRSLLLTGGVLLTGYQFVSANVKKAVKKNPKSILKEKKRVKGKVVSNGKGITGVVVSDGFSVLKTDKNGAFDFTMHTDARFVFISTPSGHAFLQEKGITKHYVPVGEITDQEVVFSLEKLPVSDEKHSFLIWADPQTKTKADVKKMMTQTVPDVVKLKNEMPEGTLLHGITVGDIVWDTLDMFPDYAGAVAEMGVPFFQCMGNHDMDLEKGGDETSDVTFNQHFGPSHYSFNRGKVHYVVLDNVRYLGKAREYDGHISNQQLAWLKKDLSFVPKDHLLVLCAHIPILKSTKNKEVLLNITKGYKMHLMTGHTHINRNSIERGVFEHNHGTVCGPWWVGRICGDGTPGGYGVYEVDGTELKWYYKSTGMPADHQLELKTQQSESGEKELLVNVWNHDPAWKVEYWLDNTYKGTLRQQEGMDPETVMLYLGKELPKTRGFVEPHKTEHLFTAALPQKAVSVKVVATDRFGKKYSIEKTV